MQMYSGTCFSSTYLDKSLTRIIMLAFFFSRVGSTRRLTIHKTLGTFIRFLSWNISKIYTCFGPISSSSFLCLLIYISYISMRPETKIKESRRVKICRAGLCTGKALELVDEKCQTEGQPCATYWEEVMHSGVRPIDSYSSQWNSSGEEGKEMEERWPESRSFWELDIVLNVELLPSWMQTERINEIFHEEQLI